MTDRAISWKDASRSGNLTIKGIQRGFGQEDVNEIVTTANYVKKDGKRYLFYREYMEDGAFQKVRLTMEDQEVILKKTGMGNSILHFRKGQTRQCIYQSPVGQMDLVSKTRMIRLRESEDQMILKMEYSLYMHNELMSDYVLELHWKAEK